MIGQLICCLGLKVMVCLCFKVVMPDMQRSIDTENEAPRELIQQRLQSEECQQSTGYTFLKYQRADTIKGYFKCLADKHSDKAHYVRFGNSYEGRELYLVKIGNTSVHGLSKPAVWIDGGIVSALSRKINQI